MLRRKVEALTVRDADGTEEDRKALEPRRTRRSAGDRIGYLFGIALLAAALLVAGAGGAAGAAEPSVLTRKQPTNRLIDSNDPYLLLHARNPVDWYPWGPEALEKAKRENKPIFLSVGYSTCYWCHVAERTIYSKQEFADLMNTWFVNIKVDREQRPDIDRLYMAATQAMTGRGGWPNNVFLTPELQPIFAGSYFPPHDDAFGRPGFDSIIESIHQAWTQDPKRVRENAEKVTAALREQQQAPEASEPIDPRASLEQAVAVWVKRADQERGGFGPAKGPRFPQAPVLALLLGTQRLAPGIADIGVLTRTLDAMAAGGIFDHLAGGFHRYGTEPTWSIPHFEKMLYDNAQLLGIYAEAFRLTGEPRYRATAIAVADYLTRQMMAPEGGFYTAEDAAVDGKEGLSYLWSRREIAAVLGGEAAKRLFDAYELAPMPDQESLQTAEQTLKNETLGVLRLRLPIEETLKRTGHREEAQLIAAYAPERKRLLEVRNRRPQPARDAKLVVALNGLAIRAFARAAQSLDMPQYVAAARASAERMWHLAYDQTSGLQHEIFNGRAQTDAFLDDYALLGLGYLALYDATRDTLWLQRARRLADALLARFLRSDGRLATTTAEDQLLMTPPEDGDNVYPCGSSAAVDLLLRLARSTGTARYADAARQVLDRLAHRLEGTPESWTALVLALNENDFRPSASASQIRLTTEAVVRASAVARTGAERDEVLVTLHIDGGYHVNANPATYDYLIATSIGFDGLTPAQVHYPAATLFKPSFAPAGLKVYEGEVTLSASFPRGTIGKDLEIRAIVSTQACNSEICLPPAKLPVTVKRDGAP